MEEKDYEKLAEEYHPQELAYITGIQMQSRLNDLQQEVEKIAPSESDVISQYSEKQYVEQNVEVMPGIHCTFRSLPPFAEDEARSFAAKHGEENRQRVLARRRLSYGLMDFNGNQLGVSRQYSASFFDLMSASDDFEDKYKEDAEKRYRFINSLGVSDKVFEMFNTWERVVFNRLNGIEDLGEVLKKSTRDSEEEQ